MCHKRGQQLTAGGKSAATKKCALPSGEVGMAKLETNRQNTLLREASSDASPFISISGFVSRVALRLGGLGCQR
jgi:hypothetical protein